MNDRELRQDGVVLLLGPGADDVLVVVAKDGVLHRALHVITSLGRMRYAGADSRKRDFLGPMPLPAGRLPQRKSWRQRGVNRLFAILCLRCRMTRALILLALLGITLAVIGSGAPGVAPLADAAAAPAGPQLLPSLDLLSLGIGVLAGLIIGWIWGLPWRNTRDLFREIFFRSMRGFGLVGITMGAAAILLFF